MVNHSRSISEKRLDYSLLSAEWQGEGISDSGVVAIVSNTMIMDVCADHAHSEE